MNSSRMVRVAKDCRSESFIGVKRAQKPKDNMVILYMNASVSLVSCFNTKTTTRRANLIALKQ